MSTLLDAPAVTTKRNDVSVKIDADVVNDARIVASFNGMTLAEYLSETLRPIVEAGIREGYQRRMGAQSPQKPKR